MTVEDDPKFWEWLKEKEETDDNSELVQEHIHIHIPASNKAKHKNNQSDTESIVEIDYIDTDNIYQF